MRKIMIAALLGVLVLLPLFSAPARAANLNLPPDAQQGLNLLYAGQPDKAMDNFTRIATADPQDPLGYLLEAEARWWQIYCESCEIKWNLIDAWQRPQGADDEAYLALTDKAIHLAEAGIARHDTATMELYAGMGWLLRARLLGLRDDRRGTAHAGVEGRAHLQRCLELDPQMADASTGLGLYNYYVDTLSALAKILRVFMGIPGGKKADGLRQLRVAMEQGSLTRVEARFYLAKNLRNYDRDYAASVETLAPLVAEFPQNPVFQLLLADTQAKLGHNESAAASFRSVQQLSIADMACAMRVRELAQKALALLSANSARGTP